MVIVAQKTHDTKFFQPNSDVNVPPENMASVSKMRMLGVAAGRATQNKWFEWPLKESVKETDVGVYNEEHNFARVAAGRATQNKWFKWPLKESVKETDVGVYNEEHNLASVEWDRIIIFPGKWYFPPVTVKPKFEFWKYKSLKSEGEVLTDPKPSTIFSMKNLSYGAGGVLLIAGIAGGIVSYVRRQQRKRFEAKVAHAAAESVRGAFSGAITQALQNFSVQDAFLQALQSPAVRDAIRQAAAEGAAVQVLQNAGAEGAVVQGAVGQNQENVDVLGALVLALQNVVVKDAIGQAARDAIAPVRTSDLTTKEVLKAHLDDAEDVKDMSLQTLLVTLRLEANLPTLQQEAHVFEVKDLLRSTVEKLVESGIPEDNAVKLKNAASYLLDLHSPSFALA